MVYLAPRDAAALLGAGYPNPAALLGPHRDESGTLHIVCCIPEAASVQVLAVNERRDPLLMSEEYEGGIFVASIAGAPDQFRYRLRIEQRDGSVVERWDPYQFQPLLGELDLHLLGEGSQVQSYDYLGAHLREIDGVRGVQFALWAPHARVITVIGDFNGWNPSRHPMRRRSDGGIWELFVPELPTGSRYKFHVVSEYDGYMIDKADPYAFTAEVRPGTASVVADLSGYAWGDQAWIDRRAQSNPLLDKMSIYEVHLGSWRRTAEGGFLNYRDLAHQLVEYVRDVGFTHIELMPITEHPVDRSWGYQTTGYYAPTSRFGTPHDFMYFVDHCHQNGIGVLLDWVPSHFAREGHGLGFFDGAHEYEHSDPRQGESQWGSFVFNYGRGEVVGFLISNALFWLDRYHLDGFRVDAVASMIYLDFLKEPGTWVPNKYGGAENLEAIAFIRRFNELVHQRFPGVVTMAEESTSWPMVSRPVYLGGLGFTMKWNMGWMHDTLEYFKADPVFRRYVHNLMTFAMSYNYSENYVLPLSHDEVVHMKSPLVYKAPGDSWRQFASLRLMLGYMWAHPGKKLLFMGGEFGQTSEWNYASQLAWNLLQHQSHESMLAWTRALNQLYRERDELYALDYDPVGFRWIDCSDVDQSILIMMRRGLPRPDRQAALRGVAESQENSAAPAGGLDQIRSVDAAQRREGSIQARALELTRPYLIFACNFTPIVRHSYRFGVPLPGIYREILSSDDRRFWGSGVINEGDFRTQSVQLHGYPQSIVCTLPPLGICVFELVSLIQE